MLHAGINLTVKDGYVIVNILFMAPRMVYCSIINLLWSLRQDTAAQITFFEEKNQKRVFVVF